MGYYVQGDDCSDSDECFHNRRVYNRILEPKCPTHTTGQSMPRAAWSVCSDYKQTSFLERGRTAMSKRLCFVSTLVVMSLLSACHSHSHGTDSDEGDDSSDQTGHFSKSSFDGAWAWYEDGTRVYDVVIDRGEITSLQRVGASARRKSYSSTQCAVSPLDGLIAFSYAIAIPDSTWVELTLFRFDLSAVGESCLEFLEAGILPGQRIVEDSDPDDIFMFPPKEVKDGELRRIDTQ